MVQQTGAIPGGGGTAADVVAADIGGTFTDVVVIRTDGVTRAAKVPSTPPLYERAIIHAVGDLVGRTAVARLAHGTTVATNALLEGKGARTALLTTRGFRDVLELARLRRPSLFDVQFVKPAPLVPRHLRLEVDERTSADGTVLLAPSRQEIDHLAERLIEWQVEAVAICFLNSFANPENERIVRDWLAAGPLSRDANVISTSSDIQREMREYERTSTAVINAYVAPTVSSYINRVTERMRVEYDTSVVHIMQSNGALLNSEAAIRFPCRLIESGPSAGVLAAAAQVDDINRGNAIAFDMGGTTAKAALIEGGHPFEAVQLEVGNAMNRDGGSMAGSGYVIRAPSLDISEVGAGGGSIVWLDGTGAPRVGPQSAGAEPGPACYGKGGTEPTVTDANLVLGFLSPESIADGRVHLQAEAARSVLFERIARPLGLDLIDAAWGIHALANVGMEAALRAVSVERGRSPGDYVLVAYGGSGPMHAATLAESFDMTTVLIPPQAGLLCAQGLTLASLREDAVRAYPPGAGINTEVLRTLTDDLTLALTDQTDGERPPDRIGWQLAVRYTGQPNELLLDFDPVNELDAGFGRRMARRFIEEHERTYGYADAHAPMEVVSVRAAAWRRAGRAYATGQVTPRASEGAVTRRQAYFGPEKGWFDTPVHKERWGIHDQRGPLIVEEMDATVVVSPGWTADCDGRGRLRLVREVS